MLSPLTCNHDPLTIALRRKARTGAPGGAETRPVAAGDGWRVVDIVCTTGPADRPFEERYGSASISLVLSGTFVCRTERGPSLLAAGAMLLGKAGHMYECSHQDGEGDRCLSFQFDQDLFERVAHEAGASRAAFNSDRLPPLRATAPLTVRAAMAAQAQDSLEEIALELAGTVIGIAAHPRRASASPAPDPARIARVLRQLESRAGEPYSLTELARIAGLSRYHFLRTFSRVTGVTPHQWLLRARLRDAAQLLIASRTPVTEIALDVGFEDLSNFIRSFRAEFGVSPSRYRTAGT